MNIFTSDNFSEIRSEPNWFWTWFIRILFLGLFGSLIVLIYAIPLAFYIDGTIDGEELWAFGVIYYPIIIGMSYLLLRYIKRVKGNAVGHIKVNREGVFYEKMNGTVESLLYKQLEASSSYIVYDVFIGSRVIHTGNTLYRQTFLKVFLKDGEKTLRFFHPDMAYSYYAGNSRLLRSHFIQGIVLFRPDLRIAPNVYTNFFIHPETYEFDKKAYQKTIAATIIFIILIFAGIECYMQYRFGNSLLF